MQINSTNEWINEHLSKMIIGENVDNNVTVKSDI